MVKNLYLLGLCFYILGLTQEGTSEKLEDSSSGLSNWKRDGSPTPNDLFWANRGKKSMGAGSAAVHSPHQQGQFWPKPHSFMGPIFKAQGQRRSSSAGLQNAFNSMRPNSFMNMYQSLQPKRSSITEQQQRMAALKNLRPNSFLFPSLSGQQGKRGDISQPLWNIARPNSHLFPQMIVNKPGKRFSESVAQLQNLRPNSFIFPIPKRDEMGSGTFFAGRGKRDPLAEEENSIAEEDDEEEGSIHQQMYKRSEDEDAVASFFAGRGKKDGLEHLTDASFFAGRGKRLPDGSDHLMTDASFFAGRGKKADLEEEQPDLASFFAGRGKRGEISEDLAFFAGRGKREAKGGDAQAGGAANNEEKAIFWAVRG